MNPQYMNPGFPQGNQGGPPRPPMSSAMPTQPPSGYPNGPLPPDQRAYQRPVGPSGPYGMPMKPDPGGLQNPMQNGPGGGGPQGEPNTMRNGYSQGPLPGPTSGNTGMQRPVVSGPPVNTAPPPAGNRWAPPISGGQPHVSTAPPPMQPPGGGQVPPSGPGAGQMPPSGPGSIQPPGPPPTRPQPPPGPGQVTAKMGAMNLGPQGMPPPPISSQYNQGPAPPPSSSTGGLPPMSSQPGFQPPPVGQPPVFTPNSMPPTSMQPPPMTSQPSFPPGPPGPMAPPSSVSPGQIRPPVGPPGQMTSQPTSLQQPMMNSGPSMPPNSMGYNAPSGTPPSPGQLPQGGQFGYPAPGGGAPGGMPRAPAPMQQQPRKLDPDQMPSPIQVIEDDKQNRSGAFNTAARGSVPPLVTTKFSVEDQGNASPRYLRSTMYNIPVSQDILKAAHIPFAMTYTPFARLEEGEHPPPIVDLGPLGPIRCNRCKAYMCPYMQFIDGGRRFQCAFCNCATEVPPEYFQHLDHTGRRTDCYERPELCLGTYEFVATTDYCKDNKLPNPPAFIFMIDVSYNSVKSGLVNLMCSQLKDEILYNLPKEVGAQESEIRVGFVTYHRELHFYNVKGSLAQPQMMIVSDIEDVFVPLLDGFLVKLSESEAVIDSLLSQIPQMFAESRETEIVLGPVIQAGLDALKSAECAGKLFIFHSSLPVAHAPGSLKNRDDRKLLGTDKEKSILTPQSNFYTKLGQECVAAGCSVELFLFPNSFIDVATVSEVPRLTGGSVHKYQYFQADLDGKRFLDDLKHNVEKPIAFDAIMRVRTSTGIRPVDFYGNFYMSNTTDVELATVDCDKAITVEIKHDDKLSEAEGAYTQAAILYTSVSGQRRLRVINLAFNCCTQMADLFRNCELDTLVNFTAKSALRQTLNGSPKQVREHIMNQCTQILACYRQKCASPSSPGQLILPECMKLLPVYSNCVIKSSMLQGGGDISTDDRTWLMFLANSMSVSSSHVYFYPRLLPLHQLDLDSDDFPTPLRCSYERLQDNGAYVLENGLTMMMWVGMNISQTWVQDVFGVHSVAQIDIDKTKLQTLDNPWSRRVRGIVSRIREERQKYLKLIIVRQRDKLEPLFQQYLVEDRGVNGTSSYVDFLCHIHKEIRSLIS